MYTHIRGSTFQFIGQFQNNGVVQDLTGFIIQAAVYDMTGTVLIGTLTVTIADPVNGIVILTFNDTGAWPIGKAMLVMQMQFEGQQIIGGNPAYFRIGQNPMVA